MNNMKVLEENGWIVECESPFEVRSEDGYSFATNQAVHEILYSIKCEEKMGRLSLLRDAYNGELIDKDKFIVEVIKLLNNE